MYNFDETDKYELKEIFNDALAKEIETFLNTKGGTIFIGITKDKKVIGIPDGKLDETMRQESDVITDKVLPRCIDFVYAHYEVMEGKDIIQIDVREGNELYYVKKYGMSPKGCHIRVGSTCKEMTPEEIKRRYIKSLNLQNPTITEMKSQKQKLTFKVFKIYLDEQKVSYDNDLFRETFNLLTPNGEYNEMAYLLSDQFDESIKVCRFKGDGGNLVMRKEFGYGCIFKVFNDIISYMRSNENIVRTYFDHGQRRDEYLYDEVAFVEAWKNAILHNDYAVRQYPQIYLYDDRLEVMSHGYALKNDTLEEFIKGVSKPINLSLSKIALNLDITDQTGKGNKDIVRAYGKKVFEIMENTLVVKIPYNELVVNVPNDGTQYGTQYGTQSETKNVASSIEDLIRSNNKITRNEIARELKISLRTLQRIINSIDKIEYVGSGRSGHWIIKN